jgi:hypothetical protein
MKLSLALPQQAVVSSLISLQEGLYKEMTIFYCPTIMIGPGDHISIISQHFMLFTFSVLMGAYQCCASYLYFMKNRQFWFSENYQNKKRTSKVCRLESSLNLISFRIFIMNLKNCLDNHQSSVPSANVRQKNPIKNPMAACANICSTLVFMNGDSENNKHC